MNSPDGRRRRPAPRVPFRRLTAAAAIIGLGLAAAGCAQSIGGFADLGPEASARPVALAPAEPQAMATVARPAVLVNETTVPTPQRSTRATAPMEIVPPKAEVATAVEPDTGIAPSAVNLNQVPEQPKSKLLSPAEKAKVIAELEALAKKQSATLDKGKKSKACSAQDLDPAQRVASATGDGGC